jgi:hypothetical protein
MVLSDRETLKIRFQKGRHLSEQDFETLIESTLNKRADHFHGLWRPNHVYCKSDVVIYDHRLWQMEAEGCICAQKPPPDDSQHWVIFPDDEDWVVLTEQQVMWAKVFDRVGIGVGSKTGELPQARLDVRKLNAAEPPQAADQACAAESSYQAAGDAAPAETAPTGQGRWLLFPQGATQTQIMLLHYAGESIQTDTTGDPDVVTWHPNQISYLVTALSLEQVTWCSDASNGFVFCRGNRQPQEADAHHLDPTNGTVMMVVQPRLVPDPVLEHIDRQELATLGLNLETPTALVDVDARQRGALRFLPDFAPEPSLYLLKPQTEEAVQPYTCMGINAQETFLVSNGEQGLGIYQGQTYGESLPPDSEVLMQIRQRGEQKLPQVGIGTAEPSARLDIHSQADQAQIQLLPDQGDRQGIPAIALLHHATDAEPTFLIAGLGHDTAGWVSNAQHGFVFRQVRDHSSTEATADCHSHRHLDQGHIHMVICEDGRVGIGTDTPAAQLEVAHGDTPGKFLFSLDQPLQPALGIFNHDPQQSFTLGTSPTHAVLKTDTRDGFLFKALAEADCNPDNDQANALDIEAGRVLVNIAPKDNDRVLMHIAPEHGGRVIVGPIPCDYEADSERTLLNVAPGGHGQVVVGRTPRDYELDIAGAVQTQAVYQETNCQRVCDTQQLFPVLRKLQCLQPITFRWTEDVHATEDHPPTSEPSTNEPSTAGEPEPAPAPATDAVLGDPWSDIATAISPDAAENAASYETTTTNPGACHRDNALEENPENRHIGLLAHEVHEVFPQVVRTASDGSQAVAYANLVPVLIQAINELNQQHQTDTQRLEKLIDQLANRIALLAIGVVLGLAMAFLGWF